MTQRIAITILAAALLAPACGDDGDPDPATRADADDGAPAAATGDTGPAVTGGDRGEGMIRLGDATYAFAVRACDFSGESDDMYQTVSGRGALPDGETFDVFVSRNDIGGVLSHSVSFQTGDVMRGQGRVVEAQRMRHGDNWMSVAGGSAEPLIRIDGDRLTASGTFTDQTDGTTVQGSIEATCR